jgi:hypothetical protein
MRRLASQQAEPHLDPGLLAELPSGHQRSAVDRRHGKADHVVCMLHEKALIQLAPLLRAAPLEHNADCRRVVDHAPVREVPAGDQDDSRSRSDNQLAKAFIGSCVSFVPSHLTLSYELSRLRPWIQSRLRCEGGRPGFTSGGLLGATIAPIHGYRGVRAHEFQKYDKGFAHNARPP